MTQNHSWGFRSESMQNQPLIIQVEISPQILGRIFSLELRLFHLSRIQVVLSSYILGCFYLHKISVETPFRKVFTFNRRISKNKSIHLSILPPQAGLSGQSRKNMIQQNIFLIMTHTKGVDSLQILGRIPYGYILSNIYFQELSPMLE